jgi:HSP20 family protein
VDIHETDGQLLVKMELAGARSEDLQVSLSPDDRVLTISGTRAEARADREGRVRCHQLEIYFGPFERSIGLPGVPLNRDEITAAYRDGFLLVTLPKRQMPPKPQKRMIPITEEHENGERPLAGVQAVATQTESEDK